MGLMREGKTMLAIPCGHLIECGPHNEPPACELGWNFPSDCPSCAAYLPGLTAQERTRCEVWTRVMGYHRPVSAFNPGKRSEHEERRYFVDRPGDLTQGPACLPTCLPAYRTGRPDRQACLPDRQAGQAGRTGRGSTC